MVADEDIVSPKRSEWAHSLKHHNAELLASERTTEAVHAEQDDDLAARVEAGWLGYPGATEEQLARVEIGLGVRLPASYRAFLAISNGWRLPGATIPRLWSTDEIEWLAVADPETVAVWRDSEPSEPPDDEYFVYGDTQDSITMRARYLASCLLISEREFIGTVVFLLNPEVLTENGEWEAWILDHTLPGAQRYRSFRALIEHERSIVLANEHRESLRMQSSDGLEHLPGKLPGLIEALVTEVARFRQIGQDHSQSHWLGSGFIQGMEEIVGQIRSLQERALTPPE